MSVFIVILVLIIQTHKFNKMNIQETSKRLVTFSNTLSKALEDNRFTFDEIIDVSMSSGRLIRMFKVRKEIREEWTKLNQNEKYDVGENILNGLKEAVSQGKVNLVLSILDNIIKGIEHFDIAFDKSQELRYGLYIE